jgi:hypothetical protein
MGWSLVNHDSLNLRYTDVLGESYIIRKSVTKFRILYDTADFVEMFVVGEIYYWNPLPGGYPADRTQFNVKAANINKPWTQSLFYYEGDDPQAPDVQTLLNLFNELLLSADVKVEKNGVFVGEEEAINFIEGANITITAVDDPANNRVNLTIASAGGAGGVTTFSGGTTGLTPAAPTAGAVTLAGILGTANGGTGLGVLGTALQYLRVDALGAALEYANFPAIPVVSPSALTASNDTNVTLTLGGTPATALLQATSITAGWTGVLAIGRGGTGLSTAPTNGQLLIGNGTGYTLSTLTAGAGVSITNGIGSITINNTGTIDDPFPKILMLMGG